MSEASTKTFPAHVIEVIDEFKIVINRGAADVHKGQRFLIYSQGKELFDPETSESLGQLELLRGTGIVTHVQDKMATITSDRRSSPRRRVIRAGTYAAMLGGGEETIEDPAEALPFECPERGDLAKPV